MPMENPPAQGGSSSSSATFLCHFWEPHTPYTPSHLSSFGLTSRKRRTSIAPWDYLRGLSNSAQCSGGRAASSRVVKLLLSSSLEWHYKPSTPSTPPPHSAFVPNSSARMCVCTNEPRYYLVGIGKVPIPTNHQLLPHPTPPNIPPTTPTAFRTSSHSISFK